jgi:hypothetical protein
LTNLLKILASLDIDIDSFASDINQHKRLNTIEQNNLSHLLLESGARISPQMLNLIVKNNFFINESASFFSQKSQLQLFIMLEDIMDKQEENLKKLVWGNFLPNHRLVKGRVKRLKRKCYRILVS